MKCIPSKLLSISWKKHTNEAYLYIKSHYTRGYERRQRVRKTWGKEQNLVFLTFSKDLPRQYTPSDDNQTDMLTTNIYPESEDLLSIKIGLGVYHASQCSQHAFFTDDDVYIFTDSVEENILSFWSVEKTVDARGYVHYNEAVVRSPNSPWAKYRKSTKWILW